MIPKKSSLSLKCFTLFYLAFKWTKPSFEQDVSWKKIDRPGVGVRLDSITSSKKFIDEMSSPMSATFKWKHCLARALFGVKNVQMSIVKADPVIIISKNVRLIGRINVDTKRRIFYGLDWRVTLKKSFQLFWCIMEYTYIMANRNQMRLFTVRLLLKTPHKKVSKLFWVLKADSMNQLSLMFENVLLNKWNFLSTLLSFIIK